jgi:trk system potassium uptake protein TrkH
VNARISRRAIGRFFLDSPERIPLFGFLALIGTGTALLLLPAATRQGAISFVDALFTATSASCVTGLIVVDTGPFFSPFGQAVIMVLIQIGGLGIMTLSTLFLLMAGRRISLAGRSVIQDTFTHSGDRNPAQIIRQVVVFTLLMEGLGTACLFFGFLPAAAGPADALWEALFHAVSAFCNAGFSLFSDSLIGFRESWLVNLTVCLLIVAGGIGFLVAAEIRTLASLNPRSWRRLSLHSKLVLASTALLILAGTGLILFMEWSNTLGALTVPHKILAALFQSITTRTAGFNTLPIGAMASETLFVVIILMFIGASPGSCGGGIKTTTFATICLLGAARLRGRDQPQAFWRKISESSVAKAISLAMLSLLVIVAGTLLLTISELGGVSRLQSQGRFFELLFEAVSAFGTVGLSMGATSVLSIAGKLLITGIMFVGRIGPLVLAVAVSRRRAPRFTYAEEKVMIG